MSTLEMVLWTVLGLFALAMVLATVFMTWPGRGAAQSESGPATVLDQDDRKPGDGF